MVRQTFEGTWEEIVEHAAELAGRRVRVTVVEDQATVKPRLDQLMAGYVGSVSSDQPHNLSERTEEVFGEMLGNRTGVNAAG
jgi:predicted RNA-binding protein